MTPLQQKFQNFQIALNQSLVERESEVELVTLGLIAKENPLLVGPPGVAKSQLLDGVASWLDLPSFSYLLTKFTDPMELFGPIDLTKLKMGENWRNTKGYLPEACFTLLDEIFKASSAILNTLLKILNERVFKYGQQEFQADLILCVAASNEWPNPETMQELGALFDRFLLRKKVRPVSAEGRKKLLTRAMEGDDFRPTFPDKITLTELEQAYKEAMNLDWTEETEETLLDIMEELNNQGIFPGDRRLVKASKIFRVKAWLEGADEVLPEHLEVLSHVLWVDPQEQPEKCEQIVIKRANPLGAILFGLQQQMFDIEGRANDRLKGTHDVLSKETIIKEVISKARDLERELKTKKETPLCIKILSYVTESRKNWDRKLHSLK